MEEFYIELREFGTIWHMSEHEKYEQVGRLAEEISHAKGKLAHVNEKLTRAQGDYAYASMSNSQVFQQLKAHEGKLIVPMTHPNQPPRTLEGLLGTHELIHVLEEKQRLTVELNGLTSRLKELAPHPL